MNKWKFIIVAIGILMLTACGSTADKKDAQQTMSPHNPDMDDPLFVAKATVVEREDYNLTTIYKGPNVASNPRNQLFIRAMKTDTGSITYQIYVIINYTGIWRFYNWAYDTYGNTLVLTNMTRNIGECKRIDCDQHEFVILDVTRKYLEENLQSGLRFWMIGKEQKAKETFFIPSGYIIAFLSLADRQR